MKYSYLFSFLIGLVAINITTAQSFTKEEADDFIKEMPSFSIHKDNYFVSGVPLNQRIDKSSADAKYQISFKYLLSRNRLPWNTYLFLTYSQKSFWNIYEESSPFQEINFNPTIGVGKPFYNKNDHLIGIARMGFEHESNGRDSISSRSWNNFHVGFATKIGKKTTMDTKLWIPLKYQEDNPELIDYIGYGEINFSHDFIPNKLTAQLMVRKGWEWNWQGAYRARLYYSPFNLPNQAFMLEWFNGYAESLINFKEHVNMVRIGYVLKTNEFDILKGEKNRK